jgi:hypothetical protein
MLLPYLRGIGLQMKKGRREFSLHPLRFSGSKVYFSLKASFTMLASK